MGGGSGAIDPDTPAQLTLPVIACQGKPNTYFNQINGLHRKESKIIRIQANI
jgi:hypothetical protein